jgi:hypothetical protein
LLQHEAMLDFGGVSCRLLDCLLWVERDTAAIASVLRLGLVQMCDYCPLIREALRAIRALSHTEPESVPAFDALERSAFLPFATTCVLLDVYEICKGFTDSEDTSWSLLQQLLQLFVFPLDPAPGAVYVCAVCVRVCAEVSLS